MKYCCYILLLFTIVSCKFFKRKTNTADETAIARAYDSYLYPSDLKRLNFAGMSKEDSVSLVQKYIKEWARHHVIAEKAIEKGNIDIESIELKAEQLKYQLITHEFEKSLISSNLDTLITEEEIKTYYQAHKSDFELKQNIVRCFFIKLHKESPKITELKKALNTNDKSFLQKYCAENADHYIVDDSTWFTFSEVVFGSPFQKVDDQMTFLQTPGMTSKFDGQYYYFFKVIEARLKNDVSPMQFHTKEIGRIIYNQRKLELIKNVEEKLFKEALDDQSIEYYY